ncbi:MAG: YdjY domain-containing protein [Nitrospirota bacterium]|jgi:hypothetical protein
MHRLAALVAILSCLGATVAVASDPAGDLVIQEQERAAAEQALRNPKIQELGGDRFRVGLIEIDRAKRAFTVPAVVHLEEGAQEFLIAARGGYKGYESTLEAGATPYEFNLACILIGLDDNKTRDPRYHFDPTKIEGDAVEIWVSWKKGDETRRVPAARLVRDTKNDRTLPEHGWVYTGSTFTADGQYLAQIDGVLVGFVHDPASIIEHATGFGQDLYGAVVPNTAVAPPKGTQVTVEVSAIGEKTHHATTP